MFLRRIGPDPHADGANTAACQGCPDIWELEDGDFAVIGIDMTAEAMPNLPPTAGCGPDERVVRLPRSLLVNAKRDIPDQNLGPRAKPPMHNESQPPSPRKPASHYVSVAVLLFIVAAIPLVLFRNAIPFNRLTGGVTGQAEDALRRRIASDSGGQISLSAFQKTDGQESEVFGVKGYSLQFAGEIAFASNGYWHSHVPMGGAGLTFSVTPETGPFPGLDGTVQVSAGNRVKIAGTMSGQKSESGWHFELMDCRAVQN